MADDFAQKPDEQIVRRFVDMSGYKAPVVVPLNADGSALSISVGDISFDSSGLATQVSLVAQQGAGAGTPGVASSKSVASGGVYRSSPISMANGEQATIPLSQLGNVQVAIVEGGGLAQASTTSGSLGSLVLFTALAAKPTYVTAQSYPPTMDLLGQIRTVSDHGKTLLTVSGTLTADTDLIAAVTSKRIKVVAYRLTTTGTTASAKLFKSGGTGGTEIWREMLQGASGSPMGAAMSIAAPSFLFATVAGEKLTLDVADTDPIHYSITYFADDAT